MAGETRTTRGTPLSPVMARSPSSPHPPGAGAALGGLRPLTAAHPRKACGRPPPSAPSAPRARSRTASELLTAGERSGGTPPVLPPHPAHRRRKRRGGCHPPAPPHGSTYRAGGGPRAPAGPALAGHHVSPPPQRSAPPHTSAPAAAPVGNRSAVTGATAAPGEPRACPACPRRRRRVAGTHQAVRSREATAPLCCPSAVPRCLPREPCWAPAARRGDLR